MKISVIILFIWVFLLCIFGCQNKESLLTVEVIPDKTQEKVNVMVQGRLFTSYWYTDTISNLKKPVLFPIIAADGEIVTRGFPLQTRPGERTDHPHHIGCWFNYGDVNGIDFWGYSDETPQEQWEKMGTIRHRQIKTAKSGAPGVLEVKMDWLKADKRILLTESTRFVFYAEPDKRTIDRITTLTAQDQTVTFNDTKEGMYAIRVNRALEHPSDKPVVLSDAHGQKTNVPVLDNTGVTGEYLNSEGIKGLETWGKRAKWVSLSGEINGKKETIVMLDHPANPGYPAYWHARGYGLFAVNPLGVRTFTQGAKSMDLTLKPGESVTFNYRMIIKSGSAERDEIEEWSRKFAGE